jgi:hypothetical protein
MAIQPIGDNHFPSPDLPWLALTGLRETWRGRRPTMQDLTHYARVSAGWRKSCSLTWKA